VHANGKVAQVLVCGSQMNARGGAAGWQLAIGSGSSPKRQPDKG
jgi:hypothetical protein